MLDRHIYLDHAATTPLDPRVLEAMLPVLRVDYGNPSSVHKLGRKARGLVEDARARVASHLGAEPAEIVFTSGGTEANNSVIVTANASAAVVTSKTEHESVLRPVERFREAGGRAEYVAVNPDGVLSADELTRTLKTLDTGFLATTMMVNNETGVVNDVAEFSRIVREHGGVLHCDAVQAAGCFKLDVDGYGVDMMTVSGHKLYGPKGVGVLYVREGTSFNGVLVGGSQERGRRGGTENVAGIVGFATALDIAITEMSDRVQHTRQLQEYLISGLKQSLGGRIVLNTPDTIDLRAPHIVNIAFPPVDDRPVDGEMMLLGLDLEGVLVSSGSACTSGTVRPSHVLLAMGRDEATASAALRLSLGKDTTFDEIDQAVDALGRIASRVTAAEPAHG